MTGPAGAPRLATGWLFVVAIAANLLITSSVALAVAPVPASRVLLDGYDNLPAGLRSVFGDEDGAAATDERGPIGSWLETLYATALAKSPRAQLALQLQIMPDVPTEEWVPAKDVNLSWRNYGAPLLYRVATTTDPTPRGLSGPDAIETTEPAARVPLARGDNWVHVQAWHEGKSGPVNTIGPFRSDPDPPPAPIVVGAPGITVEDYHFPIAWTPVQAPSGITGYVVERQGPAGWDTVARVPADTTTHFERNRPNGEYTYRVRAESGAGLLSAAHDTSEFRVTVNAQASLSPPEAGTWYRGFNAVYDSLVYTYDIHDPGMYASVQQLASGNAGLTTAEYASYTGAGWGIPLENMTLRQIVADTIGGTLQANGEITGGEKNALTASLLLFEWLFDAVDYDLARLEGGIFDLMRANETLDNGGGVCGDLTALYVTMLRIAGVPARPVHGYLINQGSSTGQEFGRIGGFHMWAEVYVGGEARDGPGGGWIPVDVSGVTGEFKEEYLHVYFGVANPNYLQLGVQEDLGDESLPLQPNGDPHPRNRWNVWANLGWSWFDSGGGTPSVEWTADARLTELEAETGRVWFTPSTRERLYCPGASDTPCEGAHTTSFPNVKGRSVRTIDYGADLSWSGNVNELTLTLRYPAETAPTQVALWTSYQKASDCNAHATQITDSGNPQWGELPGTVTWTIPGDAAQCPS